LVVHTFQLSYLESLLHEIDTRLGQRGYDLQIALSFGEQKREIKIVESMICKGMDGVIMFLSAFHQKMNAIETLVQQNVPLVVFGNYEFEPVNRVDIDWKAAGQAVTNHLIEQGHRHIAFVAESINDPRFDGYKLAYTQNNLTYDPSAFFAVPQEEEHISAITEQIVSNGTFTAIFPNSLRMASFVLRKLRHLKIRIPEQMAIASTGNIDYQDVFDPPLTTYEPSRDHLAEHLVGALFNRIENPSTPPHLVLLGGQLAVRKSTLDEKNQNAL
jgi:LacI family transcriptional regulator